MSPLVRKKLYGHQPAPICPGLPPSLESAAAAMGVPAAVLEQQLLNLTPEQLSALPPEQQAQVASLQQMLRRGA